MKKLFSIMLILLIIGFVSAEVFPTFPMTIYGNIKIGESDLEGGTLKVYSSNQELASYDIIETGKYGSDNVNILPLLLNEFEGNLDFKVIYNSKTYIIDTIDDSNKNEVCPGGSSITFISANCRYDISLKEDIVPNTGSSNNNSHSSHGKSSPKNTNNQAEEHNITNSGDALPSNDGGYNNEDFNSNEEILDNGFTRELNNAYNFSFKHGITTKTTIEDADINGYLDRIATAKMLSHFAINVLGMIPDTSKTAIFKDISPNLDSDYNNGVTLAYQLGIMGLNMDGYFRPYDKITRAEFGTALSRILYGIEDGKDFYYTPHLNKLEKEGIIKDTNPKLIEIRGYAMLMLMRASQKIIKQ